MKLVIDSNTYWNFEGVRDADNEFDTNTRGVTKERLTPHHSDDCTINLQD